MQQEQAPPAEEEEEEEEEEEPEPEDGEELTDEQIEERRAKRREERKAAKQAEKERKAKEEAEAEEEHETLDVKLGQVWQPQGEIGFNGLLVCVQYAAVMKMVKLLPTKKGIKLKQEVDEAIDKCAALLNFRNAILESKAVCARSVSHFATSRLQLTLVAVGRNSMSRRTTPRRRRFAPRPRATCCATSTSLRSTRISRFAWHEICVLCLITVPPRFRRRARPSRRSLCRSRHGPKVRCNCFV